MEPYPKNGFLEVKLGEEVRMSCRSDGVPHPIITWSFNVKLYRLLKVIISITYHYFREKKCN